MFKENDIIMFVRNEPFNLSKKTYSEMETIFLLGVVTSSGDKESKVEVIFGDGSGGFGEWFNNEELINIEEIGDFWLPTGDKLYEKYLKSGEALTRKQRYYISCQYDLWLEEQLKNVITYI